MSTIRGPIWNGTIPLRIVLAANEARRADNLEYMVIARRLSYLPLYLPEILQFFKQRLNIPQLADSIESWWFDFEGVPIKWNWPIGLSYDLLTNLDPKQIDTSYELLANAKLPWTLNLHNKDYPTDYVLKLNNLNGMWDHWLQQVKEAGYVRDGNAKAVMNLSKEDTTRWLGSAETHNYSAFWEITDRLLPQSPLKLKYVPLKIYLPMTNRPLQALVSPLKNGEANTLGSALNEHMPDLFPSKRRNIVARPVLHGAVASMESPLGELLYGAMYLDGFLHITIVLMS